LSAAARQSRPTKRQRAKAIQQATDLGPTERYQHDKISVVPATGTDEQPAQAGQKQARVETQSLLDRYMRRELIEQREFDAGQKLYRLWRKSGSPFTVVGTYGVDVRGGGDGSAEKQAEAWHAYCGACNAMGRRLAAVVVRVCCYDEPAHTASRAQGNSKDAGLALLRAGLDELADHWRM
jgi:hypothetical protein